MSTDDERAVPVLTFLGTVIGSRFLIDTASLLGWRP
jgi:hypothetical protein